MNDLTLSADYSNLLALLFKTLGDGVGLAGLTDLLSTAFKARVTVTNFSGMVLAETGDDGQSAVVPTQITGGDVPPHHRHNVGKDDVQSLSPAQSHETPTVIRVPLTYSGKQAGVLSVSRPTPPFTQEERAAILQSGGFFSVQLSQNERLAELELRLKGNFIEDLISGRFSEPESILSRARALDYDIAAPQRALVASVDNLSALTGRYGGDAASLSRFKTELVELMQSRLNQTLGGMVISHKDAFVLLVRQPEALHNDVSRVKALAEDIVAAAAASHKAKLYIGIGSVCLKLEDFSQSYLEAQKALDIGEYMITEGQVRSFEQFKVHALFLSTLKPAELYNYARDQLDALLTYDQKQDTDFLKTLQEFLYLRNNVEGTAKALSMSVSGLKYRLQKIEKILSRDLKDYKVCFDLQLALVILQLFGEYRI